MLGMRWSACRSVAWAMMTALALTMAEPPPASAGSLVPGSSSASAATATDFSSARRRHHHYRSRGDAAAFMGLVIGTMGAIAEQQRREDCYYNGCGYYYGGGPYYYGGPYYGRRYYRYYRPY